MALERELGETVSRRLAARRAGHHTALDRWIKGATYRSLIDQRAAWRCRPRHRRTCTRPSRPSAPKAHAGYAPASATARQPEAARRLRINDQMTSGTRRTIARGTSLAYHRAVARRLNRPMAPEARHVLYRWREQGRIDERYADRWEQLRPRPLPEIRRGLVDESQEADDLRQNSPFAGLAQRTRAPANPTRGGINGPAGVRARRRGGSGGETKTSSSSSAARRPGLLRAATGVDAGFVEVDIYPIEIPAPPTPSTGRWGTGLDPSRPTATTPRRGARDGKGPRAGARSSW